MSHAREHLTDVNRRRLRVGASERGIVFGWDYPGSTLLDVRILRSRQGYASSADEADRVGSGQLVVYEGCRGCFRDRAVQPKTVYWYTVYARDAFRNTEEGRWVLWARLRLRTARPRFPRLRPAALRLRRLCTRAVRAAGRTPP